MALWLLETHHLSNCFIKRGRGGTILHSNSINPTPPPPPPPAEPLLSCTTSSRAQVPCLEPLVVPCVSARSPACARSCLAHHRAAGPYSRERVALALSRSLPCPRSAAAPTISHCQCRHRRCSPDPRLPSPGPACACAQLTALLVVPCTEPVLPLQHS